jgi:hypothetical protein
MSFDLGKLFIEWRRIVPNGVPNPGNAYHLVLLKEICMAKGIDKDIIDNVIVRLEEQDSDDGGLDDKEREKAEKMGLVSKGFGNWAKDKDGPTTHKVKDGKLVPVGDDQDGEDDEDKKDSTSVAGPELADTDDYLGSDNVDNTKDDSEKPTPTIQSVTSESIDGIDGKNKNSTLSGEEKVPGTEASAVAEIGVGDAMGCLSENNNDISLAEECLESKLSKTKLGKKHGTGDGNKQKELRRGMLLGAKRENQKVKEINEKLGWENSQTSHVGGSKGSLDSTVEHLRDKGISKVNGKPLEEYEKTILEGGGGENPTDTMVVIVNEETGEAMIYHTSNKMTSKDQISNGSPAKEVRAVVEAGNYDNDEQRQQAEEAGRETRENIGRLRQEQKEYIAQQQDKQVEDSQNSEIARRIIDRLKGVENPISTSATTDKYWQALMRHKSVKDYMKENGLDSKNLTPEQEIAVYQHYVQEMRKVSDMDEPPSRRDAGGIGDDDIQILTRTYGFFEGQNQEEISTGNPPREPKFDDDKMKSYYDLQTEEMNNLREKMNNIKEGSGDKAFTRRMISRLHLNVAEGHDPGGIPNEMFELVAGEYGYKDLKQDSDGNLYQQGKGGFYKLDEDGNPTGDAVKGNELNDYDCAVVADTENMQHCLGYKEGEKVEDNFGISMGEYEGTKAILYDRDKKPIAVQTARSKSGPGGAMNDSISFNKSFQQCLAKQTKLKGKCG